MHQRHDQTPAPSVTNDDSRSEGTADPPTTHSISQLCPHQYHDPTSAPSVTPAANAHVNAATSIVLTGRKRTRDRLLPAANAAQAPANAVTPAADAAPSIVFAGRKSTCDRLLRLATRAYQCLVELIQLGDKRRPAHFGRAAICDMLGEEDGKKFKADVDKGYLKHRI